MTFREHKWWRITVRILGITTALMAAAIVGLYIYLAESLSPNNEDTMITSERKAELEAELASKGSAEAATIRYNELVSAIADDLSTLIPGLTWEWDGEAEFHMCAGEYQNTRGASVWTGQLVASAPIPESVWPRALTLVQARAGELGATELVSYADEPGRHSIAISGNGNVVRLITGGRIVVSARSDCYLREADLGQ